MAGFSSLDAYIAAITTNGQFLRTFFSKTSSNGAAGVASRMYSWFDGAGVPGSYAWTGAAGSAQTCSDASAGALDIGGNKAPLTRHLVNWSMVSPTATVVPSQVLLVDILGYHPSCVVTGTPTTISAMTLPARDNAASSNGDGVMVAVIVQTALGAAQPSITLTFNPSDNSGNVASPLPLISHANSAPISTAFNTVAGGLGTYVMALPAGKKGVKTIASYVINSGGTTGTVAFVYFRVIASIPLVATNVQSEKDFLFQTPSLPRIYDGSCLTFMNIAGGAMATSSSLQGFIEMGWN